MLYPCVQLLRLANQIRPSSRTSRLICLNQNQINNIIERTTNGGPRSGHAAVTKCASGQKVQGPQFVLLSVLISTYPPLIFLLIPKNMSVGGLATHIVKEYVCMVPCDGFHSEGIPAWHPMFLT